MAKLKGAEDYPFYFGATAETLRLADGSVHLNPTQAERDSERTRILNQLGMKVIRFTNNEVENNINQVISLINKELNIPRLS